MSGTRLDLELPLWSHPDPGAIVAWRKGRPLTAAHLRADVIALAERLPPGTPLNACGDRYLFAVALLAALLRRQTCVLPHDHASATLARLARRHDRLYVLRDDVTPLATLPSLQVEHLGREAVGEVPTVPAAHVAAVLFTSGSTGAPVAHARSWGSMVSSARAEASRFGFDGAAIAIVGTVPAQHSYGLESTVMLALHGAAAIVAEHPFFPADVFDVLHALPRPRLLVTTPVHLRALTAAHTEPPAVDTVVCATAPLPLELARQAEQRFGGRLLEIYGSTESGQLASRAPTRDARWTPLADVRIGNVDGHDAATWYAEGGHVERRTPLADLLELHADGGFTLVGRSADMINIGGKRSSLAYLNQMLLTVDGIVDAAFATLPGGGERDARLAAFYVGDGIEPEQVIAALRERIDPVFLPRPLQRVSALPRDATGKLSAARLRQLADSLQERRR